MNILIFSWRGPSHPNAGGAEISTHEHAKGWVGAGHEVTLFTSAFAGCRKEEIKDGVKIIRRGKQILGVQWEAFKWYLFGRHSRFDLVIDQFHGIPFFTPIFVRTKKLAFIHEVTKEVWKLNPWRVPMNWLPSVLGTFFEPLIFKLFYTRVPFMTVSNSTKKDLVQWGIDSSQIAVIFNGIRIEKINLLKKEKKKTLVFLGALSKDKGIEEAIEAFQLIDQLELKQWRFWIIGKAESRYLEKLKQQCMDLGIKKSVTFWGFVSEKKKFELLSKSHIVINSSIREGWGLVVIEAASMGVPTVAYNVPGLRDSILNNKTGIICFKKTPTCLASEIVNLINDSEKYQQMSTNARQWSKRFAWDKSTKSSLLLLKHLTYS
jgi:glycosyltransferase involved in cell wall biosynthesis